MVRVTSTLSLAGGHGKEVEQGLGPLATSALDGLQSSASLSGRFNPEKKSRFELNERLCAWYGNFGENLSPLNSPGIEL
jgi:hypothetical protein